MLDDDRRTSARVYLDSIITALRAHAHIRPRVVLDPWFAFEAGNDVMSGATFLTGGSQPHTFDNPCPWKHWRTLRHGHFWVTPAARSVLDRAAMRDRGVRKDTRDPKDKHLRLMVDHSIPLARIIADMREDEALWSPERLRDFLLHHFRRGVLTKAEDEAISGTTVGGVCLRDQMPPSWRRGGDPFARYSALTPPLERAV